MGSGKLEKDTTKLVDGFEMDTLISGTTHHPNSECRQQAIIYTKKGMNEVEMQLCGPHF